MKYQLEGGEEEASLRVARTVLSLSSQIIHAKFRVNISNKTLHTLFVFLQNKACRIFLLNNVT